MVLKRLIHILVFILPFGMSLSPAMAYISNSMEKEVLRESCCSHDESQESTDQEESQQTKECHHSQKDCCGNNCPKSNCCLHLNVYQTLSLNWNELNQLEIPLEFHSTHKNDYYRFFHVKELIYSVWQPPKLISWFSWIEIPIEFQRTHF